ncbi:MAG: TIGR04282 family arsenosugar biosynthesis glycosyltransferase [Pseudomonadota bacterium]
MSTPHIAIMCRYPVPGQAKTRLIPALGPDGAAGLHKTLAERTVATVRASGVPFALWGTGAEEAQFLDWLGGLSFGAQASGDLGDRLLAAAKSYPVIFLGTDAPDLTPEHLQQAAEALGMGRAVIGPAADGGYWLLGLPQPADDLFFGIHWGTETVYQATREKMAALGIDPVVLEELHDLDRPEDLDRWPDLRP